MGKVTAKRRKRLALIIYEFSLAHQDFRRYPCMHNRLSLSTRRSPSREEARNCLGHWLPTYPPLSGCVSKDGQTMQHVSSSLSKIPYVGFSPVRLQTGIQPRPSPKGRSLSAMPAYTQTTLTYTRLKLLQPTIVCHWQANYQLFRSRAFAQAERLSSTDNHPVQSPLARQRVMLSHRVIAYYGLIRNSRLLSPISRHRQLYAESLPDSMIWAEDERLPNLICLSLLACRLPYPGGPNDSSAVPKSFALAFTLSAEARHPHLRTRRFSCGGVTRLQSSLYATACKVARPSPTRTFTLQLSPPRVTPGERGVSLRGQTANSRDRTCTG